MLTACQSGIGPEIERPRATARAYERQVAELQRKLAAQEAQLTAVASPAAPTAVPPSFAERWRVKVAGPVERRSQVGVRDGLTPLAAAGSYLVVPIEITNLTDAPAAFNPGRELVLADGEDRTFDLDPAASGAAYLLDFGYEASFAPRQPGIPYADVLVFDVPTDAEDLVLQSTDESFSVPLER